MFYSNCKVRLRLSSHWLTDSSRDEVSTAPTRKIDYAHLHTAFEDSHQTLSDSLFPNSSQKNAKFPYQQKMNDPGTIPILHKIINYYY